MPARREVFTPGEYRCPSCRTRFLTCEDLAIHQRFCQKYKDEHAPTLARYGPKPKPKPKPKPVVLPEYKTCIKCGKTKPQHEFTRRPQNSDGLCGLCKTCLSEYQKNWKKVKNARP